MIKVPEPILRFCGNTQLSKYPMWVQYKPQPHRLKGKDIKSIRAVIKPGDILLSRCNGYISTFFIPGFWSHGAMYLGNDEVGHAIGKGGTIEHILDHCRRDSMVVLRLKDQSNVASYVENARNLIEEGFEYDFNFIDDDKNLYCTEYINTSCNEIFDYNYEEIMGNLILTPGGIYNSILVDNILEIRH